MNRDVVRRYTQLRSGSYFWLYRELGGIKLIIGVYPDQIKAQFALNKYAFDLKGNYAFVTEKEKAFSKAAEILLSNLADKTVANIDIGGTPHKFIFVEDIDLVIEHIPYEIYTKLKNSDLLTSKTRK